MSAERRPDGRPSLLYLVHRAPYPPDKGDRIRTFHVLDFLSRRADVYLACLADEPLSQDDLAALGKYCQRIAIIPIGRRRWLRALASFASGKTITAGAFASPQLGALLQQWTAEIDFHAALASSSSMVSYLQNQHFRAIPAVVDLIDVDSQKWFDYAQSSSPPRSWLYRTEGRRLRRLEQGLTGWTRAVTVVSEAEAALYRDFCPQGNVWAIPNGVNLDYFQPRPEATEPSCVFVGALDYHPNVDAACWFARTIWPAIHLQDPESKLYLVGRRPAPAVARLIEVPGVEVVGQVPDVRPYVARAAVSVNPLRIARGVQNKVLEALAMSKATVGSPEALTGLAVEPGVHVLQAATPQEWVETVHRLFADADLRRRLGAAGRLYVEERHRWEHCLEPFATLLDLPACGRHHDEAAPALVGAIADCHARTN